LEIHPGKTKIVYCKDSNRCGNYPNISFDFLGFTFRPREANNKRLNRRFTSFTPAVSKTSMKAMRAKIKRFRIVRRSELELKDIAIRINPVLRGWINYYGKYHSSELDAVFRNFNRALVRWAMNKYKKLHGRKTKTVDFLSNLAKEKPRLFVHWSKGRSGAFT
jgi:hypothetical protein